MQKDIDKSGLHRNGQRNFFATADRALAIGEEAGKFNNFVYRPLSDVS